MAKAGGKKHQRKPGKVAGRKGGRKDQDDLHNGILDIQKQIKQHKGGNGHVNEDDESDKKNQRPASFYSQPIIIPAFSSSSSSTSSIPPTPEAKAGGELLLTYDHKQVRWWEVVDFLIEGGKGGGKDKKKAKGAKKQNDGGGKRGGNQPAAAATAADVPNLIMKEKIQRGQSALAAAQALFEAKRAKNLDQDMKWTEKVLRQGTLSDKVAALTLLIQEAPLFRLRTLDTLLSLASKSDRRCSQMAIEAVKDLLEHNLLPDRKLTPWGLQDSSTLPPEGPQREALLAIRFFEDQLKQRVIILVARLEKSTFDTVENFKRFNITIVAELLQAKPEQEEKLLSILVNKLGDVERKVAPHAAHLLRRILSDHPSMKAVVAREVQQLLHRPNLQPRGLYNGITFLDQLYLKKGDNALAMQLIKTYFGLFDRALKAGDLSGKMLSALLTGVNRAYPYLEGKEKSGDEGPLAPHMEDLFRTVHQGSFKTAVQALMLLNQVAGSQHGSKSQVEQRFYRALYDKLKAPELLSTASPVLFLNLVYKAMKADRDDARVAAFAKRLLSMASHGSAALAAGAIFLLSEVMRTQPALLKAVTTSALSEEIEVYDPMKREPSFAFTGSSSSSSSSSKEADGGNGNEKEETVTEENGVITMGQPHLWELALLRLHFHPSVQHFAQTVTSSDNDYRINYAGDPLTDFSTMAFLDRFSYKNPKLRKETAGGDARGAGALQRKAMLAEQAAKPVNTAEFLSMKAEELGPDKLFFHKFFKEKAQRDRKSGKGLTKDGEDSDDESDYDDDDYDADDVDDESDDDERGIDEYATKLAESLMNDKGKANYDDEDVDMDDWGDLGGGGSDAEEEEENEGGGGGEDDDAFMDGLSSDDNYDTPAEEEGELGGWVGTGGSGELAQGEEEEEGGEEDEEDDDDEDKIDWDDFDEEEEEEEDKKEEEEELELGKVSANRKKRGRGDVSSEEEDEEEQEEKEVRGRKKAKKGSSKGASANGGAPSVFASFEDYEALLEKDVMDAYDDGKEGRQSKRKEGKKAAAFNLKGQKKGKGKK